ncbi:MAG TPA: DUF6790 family protein [Bauldia sp.]|nr:DUF6790 family protein [Bauldia sp.]
MTGMTDFRPVLDWALDNPELSLLAVAAVFAFLTLALMSKPHSGRRIVEVLFRAYLLFVVALLFLDKAAGAGLFGPDAAAAVHGAGPASLPAGWAYLAFAILGLLALSRSIGLRAAAVAGPSVYLLGPLVASVPANAQAQASAPEVAVVLAGAFLLLLQVNVDRPAPPLPRGLGRAVAGAIG